MCCLLGTTDYDLRPRAPQEQIWHKGTAGTPALLGQSHDTMQDNQGHAGTLAIQRPELQGHCIPAAKRFPEDLVSMHCLCPSQGTREAVSSPGTLPAPKGEEGILA